MQINSGEVDNYEHEIRRDARRVHEAEMNGETIENGNTTGLGEQSKVSKNTHFEYTFGDNDMAVYLERIEHTTGIEVMFWVDKSLFSESIDSKRNPSLGMADDIVQEIASQVLSIVTDELNLSHDPSIEYY